MPKRTAQPWTSVIGLIFLGVFGGLVALKFYEQPTPYEQLRKIPNGDPRLARIFYVCASGINLESGSNLGLRLEKQLGTDSGASGASIMDALVEILSKEAASSIDRDRAYVQFIDCVRAKMDVFISSPA